MDDVLKRMGAAGRPRDEIDLVADGLRFRAFFDAAIVRGDESAFYLELDEAVAVGLGKDPETLDELRVVIDVFRTARELRS